MQVNVIMSTVAGQETVATADVQAFMAAMEKQLGADFNFTLDTDYGQSLTDHSADVYLVYFGSKRTYPQNNDPKCHLLLFR